jgi:hypothetical protein
MRLRRTVAAVLLVTATFSGLSVVAADPAPRLLPRTCIEGWVMNGEVTTYKPENLYKYIDGEAELYLPYGFEKAEAVLYADPGHKAGGLTVNVFRMGSPLDAFGIYSNYRSTEAEPARVGAEGFVEESQAMFYQGPYFVQIMASGSIDQPSSLFLACAAALSKGLSGGAEKPRELDLLRVPGLIAGTERYYAQGVLGYAFLGSGLTANVSTDKGKTKVFVLLGNSADEIKGDFEAYAKQLKESKARFQISEEKGNRRLIATDPLYKGVCLQQSGRFAVGVAGLADPREGEKVIGQLLTNLPTQ